MLNHERQAAMAVTVIETARVPLTRPPRGRVHPPPAAAANRSDSAPATCARDGAQRARRFAHGSYTGRRALGCRASTQAGRGFDRPLASQAEEIVEQRWHSTSSPRPSCSLERGPTTGRRRAPRSPLLDGASGGLARLQVTRRAFWRLRTQRGRRAVMHLERWLRALACWSGTLGGGPARRRRLYEPACAPAPARPPTATAPHAATHRDTQPPSFGRLE